MTEWGRWGCEHTAGETRRSPPIRILQRCPWQQCQWAGLSHSFKLLPPFGSRRQAGRVTRSLYKCRRRPDPWVGLRRGRAERGWMRACHQNQTCASMSLALRPRQASFLSAFKVCVFYSSVLIIWSEDPYRKPLEYLRCRVSAQSVPATAS